MAVSWSEIYSPIREIGEDYRCIEVVLELILACRTQIAVPINERRSAMKWCNSWIVSKPPNSGWFNRFVGMDCRNVMRKGKLAMMSRVLAHIMLSLRVLGSLDPFAWLGDMNGLGG